MGAHGGFPKNIPGNGPEGVPVPSVPMGCFWDAPWVLLWVRMEASVKEQEHETERARRVQGAAQEPKEQPKSSLEVAQGAAQPSHELKGSSQGAQGAAKDAKELVNN